MRVDTFSRETVDPWFVTGLCEGAASWTFSRSGKQLSLYLSIHRPAADALLLEAVQAFFGGAGKLYPVSNGRSLYLRMTRLPDLLRTIEHFDSYPLIGAQSEVYAVWREMVLLKHESRRRPDRERLAELAAKLTRRQ